MDEFSYDCGLVIGVTLSLLAFLWFCRKREHRFLKRWADDNHFEFLEIRQRKFLESAPFSFWTSHSLPNYFVRVRDQSGKESSAWLRLGNITQSILWNKKINIEVKWDQQTTNIL